MLRKKIMVEGVICPDCERGAILDRRSIGTSAGLGFETAKHFARMNPVGLVLTPRDEVRGNRTLA